MTSKFLLTIYEITVVIKVIGEKAVHTDLHCCLSIIVCTFYFVRKSYLILCGILGASCWLVISSIPSPSATTILTSTILSSATIAMSDVIVDSLVVELSRDEDPGAAGALQSLCWGSRSVGAISSSYFAGSLVQRYGPQYVFGLTSCLPLFTAAAGWLSTEQKVETDVFARLSTMESGGQRSASTFVKIAYLMKEQAIALWDAGKQPTILLPTLFMFCWRVTPSPATAMFFYFTEELSFDADFMGQVKFVSSFASLAGVIFYNIYLKRVSLRKIYFWSSIVGTVLGLSQLLLISGVSRQIGLGDKLFVVGDEVILSVLGEIAFLPSLVLAAKVCPEGVEASLFAAMMSVFNGGMVISQIAGSVLTDKLGVTKTDFSNLWLLVLICNISSLLPLPFLFLVPEEEELNKISLSAKESNKQCKD